MVLTDQLKVAYFISLLKSTCSLVEEEDVVVFVESCALFTSNVGRRDVGRSATTALADQRCT